MRLTTTFTSMESSWACWKVRKQLGPFVEGLLPSTECRQLRAHLNICNHCAIRHAELERAKGSVRNLRVVQPPAELTAALRGIARQELERDTQAAVARWAWEGLWLRMRNVMEPLAIPCAGGLVSTLMLFSMLAPAYPGSAKVLAGDVPTPLYEDAAVRTVAPFGFASDEVIVEVTLDEEGRVIDYTLPEAPTDQTLRRAIGNSLLFTTFTPARSFGQPMSGRFRFSFRRSQIDVKG